VKQCLTGDDLFNLLMMLRTTDKRTFVVLEGDTDCEALDPHVNERAAATFPAHSKSAAERTLELIDHNGMPRVLVIVDRDWVGTLESPRQSPNVVYTDDYDLDATILFAGSVLDRVVSTHSRRDVREAYLAGTGLSVEETLIDLTSPVGFLRFASERDALGLNCRAFPVHEVLAPTCDRVDVARLSRIAVKRSPNSVVAEAAVVRVVESRGSATQDPRYFCGGHDLAAALAALLKQWGGSSSRAMIERAARAALSCADLMTTQLFAAVADWARARGVTVWSCAT
jgi:hypothetical protein